MKKIIIAVIVVLAGALIGLKYFASREQAPVARPAGQAQQTDAQGVALPAAATDSPVVSQESTYIPDRASGTYELLTMPPAIMALKGSCEGGSPKDIMESHGKVWGYFTGRRAAFDAKKTQEMYDFMGSYYACLAAARQDITICNELPGEAEKDGVKVDVAMSPLGSCRTKAGLFLFRAYIAGRAKDTQNCMGYLSDWNATNLARISPPDFCAAAAKGPEAIMAYTKEKMPEMYSMAENLMAFSRKACGADPVCLNNNTLWEGIKSGNPEKCPASLVPLCSALVQKSQVPCAEIVFEMSRKYCAYHKDLVKGSGGFAGFTSDEAKEQVRELMQKKAEEERQRKEQESTTKQVNERVRKLVGKQGGD